MRTVTTGWRTITPGKCLECGFDDNWSCDGRGNVLCECQACPDCGLVDAYGFHEPSCPQLRDDALTQEDWDEATIARDERRAEEGR